MRDNYGRGASIMERLISNLHDFIRDWEHVVVCTALALCILAS